MPQQHNEVRAQTDQRRIDWEPGRVPSSTYPLPMAASTKSIRITEETQRTLRLVSAFEERTEATIVEDALAAYLQILPAGHSGTLPEALGR